MAANMSAGIRGVLDTYNLSEDIVEGVATAMAEVFNTPEKFRAMSSADLRAFVDQIVTQYPAEEQEKIRGVINGILGQMEISGEAGSAGAAAGDAYGANLASGVSSWLPGITASARQIIDMLNSARAESTAGGAGGWGGMHSGGPIMHAGGEVPRAHKGLAPDERPIIAQTGEYVVSRKGVNAVGVGALNAINSGSPVGGATVININAGYYLGSPGDARRMAKEIIPYLKSEAAR
jgi:hypothetical protein